MKTRECQGTNMEDELLKQLVLKAQQHSSESVQRQIALNKLMGMVLKSPSLGYPHRELCPPGIYQDIRNEALQEVIMEICQRIDNYNPQHQVMAWVNFLLNRRFLDVLQKYNNGGMRYLPSRTSNQQPVKVRSLDELERDFPDSQIQTNSSDNYSMRQFVEEDPEHLLNEHIQARPEVTFQIILLTFLDHPSWREVSRILKISESTLHSFKDRQFRKWRHYFQKYICE
ncbi:MAG: hypothetical protein NHB32_19620 [Fischerella sp. CENA71]|nr:hypothetical protein [Fischerella sp. CENA71]